LKLIGLTGGPGCGKSAVLKIFSAFQGWRTFDADCVCRELYEEKNSRIFSAFRQRWGAKVFLPDDSADRKAIAGIVFSDDAELQWLNSLMHPEIIARIESEIDGCACTDYIMIDIPLLFETGYRKKLHAAVCVWSSPEVQAERLASRAWSPEHSAKRISSQFSADKKLELADFAIINNASLDSLKKQCEELDTLIKSEI